MRILNAHEFKDYLLQDDSRIIKLLESLGCHSFWRTGEEIRCAPEGSENKTAISVRLSKGLSTRHYRLSNDFSGDILGFVQESQGASFKESFSYCLGLFGLSKSFTPTKINDKLSFFKSVRGSYKKVQDLDDIEIETFGLYKLQEYISGLHINLFYEGILQETAELFRLGVDDRKNRIIFPHFAYNSTNRIVGITGRTLYSEEDMRQFDIPKYWNYIKGYKKMFNLYGFSHALEYAIKNKMLVIFEAEKSVLKNFSQQRNKGFSCAVGGHELSEQQVQIILRNLPRDVEIVIAFDKDIMKEYVLDEKGEKTDELFLERVCSKFPSSSKVSYIVDENNLLGDKDSPIDKGYKVFNELLDQRKKYKKKREL